MRRRLTHPAVVLALAIVLPGAGHVVCRLPTRALTFLFFMLMLGAVSYHLTTPQHSFLGRHAGGVFVYAISVLDAYRIARFRWSVG